MILYHRKRQQNLDRVDIEFLEILDTQMRVIDRKVLRIDGFEVEDTHEQRPSTRRISENVQFTNKRYREVM